MVFQSVPLSGLQSFLFVLFLLIFCCGNSSGIILDAYVDMSSRLVKEASYREELEKSLNNEQVLLSAFEKTSFLVCLRPAVPISSGSQLTLALPSGFQECGGPEALGPPGAPYLHYPYVGCGRTDSTQECTAPSALKESDTGLSLRGAAGGSSSSCAMVLHAGAATPAGTNNSSNATGPVPAASSPRASLSAPAAPYERKLTGVLSEDSTARPSTETTTDLEPLQQLAETHSLEGLNVCSCVKYIRLGGHQPMDMLKHPIVLEALQVRTTKAVGRRDIDVFFRSPQRLCVYIAEQSDRCDVTVGVFTFIAGASGVSGGEDCALLCLKPMSAYIKVYIFATYFLMYAAMRISVLLCSLV